MVDNNIEENGSPKLKIRKDRLKKTETKTGRK